MPLREVEWWKNLWAGGAAELLGISPEYSQHSGQETQVQVIDARLDCRWAAQLMWDRTVGSVHSKPSGSSSLSLLEHL